MADSRLDLIIKARDEASASLKRVTGEIEKMGSRAKSASSGVGQFFSNATQASQKFATVAGAAFVASGVAVAKYGSNVQDLNNKLINVGGSQEIANEYFDKISDVANRSRSSLDATASTFQRFEMVNKRIGVSTEESFRMTETLNKGLQASGATATEAASAQLQLAQAYASGKLQGDEFRSLSEAFPSFMMEMADTMGVTSGELKELGSKGLITGDQIRATLGNMGEVVDGQFKTMPVTIGQAFTLLNNNVLVALKKINEGTGILDNIANAIKFVGDMLLLAVPHIVSFIQSLDAEKLAIIAGVIVGGIAPAFGAFAIAVGKVLLVLTPFFALGGLIGAMLYQHRDEILPGLMVAWEQLQKVFAIVSDFIMSQVIPAAQAIADGFMRMVGIVMPLVHQVVDFIVGQFQNLVESTGISLEDIQKLWSDLGDFFNSVVLPLVDFFVQAMGVAFELVKPVVEAVTTFIGQVFGAAFTTLQGVINFFIGVFTGDWTRMKEGIIQIAQGLWDGVVSIFTFLKNTLVAIVSGVVNALKAGWELLWSTTVSIFENILKIAVSLWNDIVNGITSAGEAVMGAVNNIWDSIVRSVQDLTSKAYKWGVDLIQGMINGIKSMAGAAASAVGNVANGMAKSVTGFFGIRSPSRLMMEYGGYIMEGLANGVTQAQSGAEKAMSNAMQGLQQSASFPMEVRSTQSLGQSEGERVLSSTTNTSNGANITIQIEQMIGDEEYAKQLGDMIVKNLSYNTAF